jgi:DNA invertase Pin-like site-specific DNA recombinase
MLSSPPSLIALSAAADALEVLEDLKGEKIGLHLIDLGGDVCGNGIFKLVFTILSAVAENERDRIRERVRDAKRHRAEQRLYNGGKRQFGWDVVDGRLVPNAAEQAVIERMRSMRANGATYRAIGSEIGMQARSIQRILNRV